MQSSEVYTPGQIWHHMWVKLMIGSCLTPKNFFQILLCSFHKSTFFYCGVFSYKPIGPNSKLNVLWLAVKEKLFLETKEIDSAGSIHCRPCSFNVIEEFQSSFLVS